MKIKYTPQLRDDDGAVLRDDDGKPLFDEDGIEIWEFDENDLLIGEIKLLEKVTKLTFGEFGEMLERDSLTAIMALVWIFRRRHDFDLRIDDDDDVSVSEIEVITKDEPDDDGDDEGKAPDPSESDTPAGDAQVA